MNGRCGAATTGAAPASEHVTVIRKRRKSDVRRSGERHLADRTAIEARSDDPSTAVGGDVESIDWVGAAEGRQIGTRRVIANRAEESGRTILAVLLEIGRKPPHGAIRLIGD